MKANKTALAVALTGALGMGGLATAHAATTYNPYTYTGSNFSMRSGGGNAIGGTNDVSGSWNGTVFTSCSEAGVQCNFSGGSSTTADNNSNMSLSSPTTFFGGNWTAHGVQVFGQGTYTFTETNGATHTMTVGAGQVGAHMLFNWGANSDIGVIDVFNVNGNYTAPFWSGANTTSDSWSGTNNHIWGLASTGGSGMVNGAFIGYMANFNVYNGSNVAPVPIPAAAWLFGSGLIGLVGVSRRRKRS